MSINTSAWCNTNVDPGTIFAAVTLQDNTRRLFYIYRLCIVDNSLSSQPKDWNCICFVESSLPRKMNKNTLQRANFVENWNGHNYWTISKIHVLIIKVLSKWPQLFTKLNRRSICDRSLQTTIRNFAYNKRNYAFGFSRWSRKCGEFSLFVLAKLR